MSTEINSPSAGDLSSGVAGSASPPESTAPLSDDQILDQETVSSPEAEAEPKLETAAEGETKPDQQATEEKPEDLVDVVEPEEWKQVFKIPVMGPKVRDLFYREAAFQQLGTVAQQRELRELYPTNDDAKAAATARTDLERFDEMFYDPAKHGEFLETLHNEDPQMFKSIAGQFPQLQFQIDPEGYRNDTAERIQSTLTNIKGVAQAEGNEELQAAVDLISQSLFGKTADQLSRATQPDPRETSLRQREEKLQKAETEAQTQKFQAFYGATNEVAVNEVVNQIKTLVDKTLTGSPISDKAKERVIGDIYNEIDATLKSNRELRQQLRRAYRDGDLSPAHQKKVSDLLVNRARLLLKPAVTKVVNEWTKNVLATNQNRLEKQKVAASRADITGGASSGLETPSRNITPRDIDYHSTTDDDILSGKPVLRKR